MAQNLQLLRTRIKTAKNISQIAKAMEMIAASKIKRAQTAVENNGPYSEKITEMVDTILYERADVETVHPYMQTNSAEKNLLIGISPDKGLAGGLPGNLIRELIDTCDKNTFLVTVGRKLERFAVKSDMRLIATFPAGTVLPSYGATYPLMDIINEYYLGNKVSRISVMYASFDSLFVQKPVVETLLPIYQPEHRDEEKAQTTVYTYEPHRKTLLGALLPQYIEVKLYQALIEAFSSEQAARMIAMQNAKNNATDIADFLTLSYNKERQSRITGEILDLANVQFA